VCLQPAASCYAALGFLSFAANREAEPKMLIELRAENYAVIDHAIASLAPGSTCYR
jgi:hypothetical protein